MKKKFIIMCIISIAFPKIVNTQNVQSYGCLDNGLSRVKVSDYYNAIIEFTKCIELNPTHAKAYYYRGKAKSELKQYRDALIDLDKAIHFDSYDGLSYWDRGVAKFYLDDYNGAISDFNKLMQLKPEYESEAYYMRANSYGKLGKIHEACWDWEKASRLGHSMASGNLAKFCSWQ